MAEAAAENQKLKIFVSYHTADWKRSLAGKGTDESRLLELSKGN